AQGDVLWAHGFGVGGPRGTQHMGEAITVDGQGSVYVTGSFTETVDFNPSSTVTNNLTSGGGTDVFILKLTNTGDFIWVQSKVGHKGSDCIDSHADGIGNVYAVGWFVDLMNMQQTRNKYTLRSNALGDGWSGYLTKSVTNRNYLWGSPIGSRNSSQALVVR